MIRRRFLAALSTNFLDQPLAFKGLTVIAVPLVCFLAALTSVFLAEWESRKAENYVRATLTIQSDILELHTLLAEAASGIRGYLLSGNGAFLTPFNKARSELPGVFMSMRSQIRDAKQLARLNEIEPLVFQKMKGLNALKDNGGQTRQSATDSIRNTLVENKLLLDTLRMKIHQMREREDHLLAIRTGDADVIRNRSQWITLCGAIFGLLGGITAIVLMSNGIVRRVDVIKEAAHKLASGQEFASFPSARDELGELAAALENASVLLKAREKALRESEERFRLLVDDVHDYGIFGLDNNGNVVSWNSGAERITGYEADEVLGKHFSKLYPEETRKDHPARELSQAQIYGRIEDEGWRLRKNGSRFWANVVVTALKDEKGKPRGFSKIIRDMTDRKKAEEALRAAHQDAERASLAKSQFLSRMSHELRTPLNSILGFGQILEMDLGDTDAQFSINQILKAGRHLLSLIDEVLDIGKIEAGRMELLIESVDVGEVLSEAIGLASPLADERNISVHLDDAQFVHTFSHVDRRRLLQILLNLLSNAIKYNHAGGRIVVVPRSATEQLTIEISDSGDGIDDKEKDRLFRPFERLGRNRNTTNGTGLGLALSKHLMESMGGGLELMCTSHEGSTFALHLPVGAGHEHAEPARHIQMVAMAKKSAKLDTVLYIEDNSQSFELVEKVMTRSFDCNMISAMLGATGLALAVEHKPDLVLLDLDLPDISGLDVLRQLQSDERTQSIPVIVISADATELALQQAAAAQAAAYLTKPLDLRLLVQKAEKLKCN